jgi:hypothetical protein
MLHATITAAFLCLALGDAAPDSTPKEPDPKAVLKTRQSLDHRLSLPATETTFGKLLESLEKQLPEDKKIALRIDKEAFGKDAAKIAEAPVRLQKLTDVSLITIVRLALAQVSTRTDYRIEAGAFVITTPARALYTASHDIRDLVEDPAFDPASTRLDMRLSPASVRKLDPAARAAGIAQMIVRVVAPESWLPTAEPHGTIQILNGTRLVIHTNASRHAEIDELLDALRRLTDIPVALDARLYSVDRETYTKIKTAKRLSRAEMEEQAAKGGEALGKLLAKQKLVVAGRGVRILNGLEGVFLSQHNVVVSPPIVQDQKLPRGLEGNPDLTEAQAALEGVSFSARVTVSADRRFVDLKITEKATEIDELPKVQFPKPKKKDKGAPEKGEEEEEQVPDIQEQVVTLLEQLRLARPLRPVLGETVYSHEVGIPDGGSRAIAVRVRPRALETAERWWVLVVTPQIIIRSEQQDMLNESLKSSLPALLTDILKNPRLKTTRAFYGSPDDPRYALVPSEAWAWSEPPAVPDFRLTPAERKGNRLLGIRIDRVERAQQDEGGLIVSVSLLNAGGEENGAVPGTGRVRYLATMKDKKWEVKLAKPKRGSE